MRTNPQLTRADIDRSMRHLSLLWARPPDPENETAGLGANPEPAAFELSKLAFDSTPVRARRKVAH